MAVSALAARSGLANSSPRWRSCLPVAAARPAARWRVRRHSVAGRRGGGLLLGWARRSGRCGPHREPLGAGNSGLVSATVPRTRRLLVSAQDRVSLALVVGAVLFSRSLAALAGEDLGFPRRGLVALDFDLAPDVRRRCRRHWPATRSTAWPRSRAWPARRCPIALRSMDRCRPWTCGPPGRARPSGRSRWPWPPRSISRPSASRIVAGGTLQRVEWARGDGVVIVNGTLARRLWPDRTAIDTYAHRRYRTAGGSRRRRRHRCRGPLDRRRRRVAALWAGSGRLRPDAARPHPADDRAWRS